MVRDREEQKAMLKGEGGEGEENSVSSYWRIKGNWESSGLRAPTHREDKENTLKLHKIICSR